jgi:hypothetical protein
MTPPRRFRLVAASWTNPTLYSNSCGWCRSNQRCRETSGVWAYNPMRENKARNAAPSLIVGSVEATGLR